MVKPNNPADRYVRTQVESSTPLELVVLLYDAALRFTQVARDAMVRRDIAARREALSKAMGAVSQLQSTIDMEQGGTIATDLDRLYTWVLSRLVAATVEQKVQPIDDARNVLKTLSTAWRTIANRTPAEAQP